MAVPLMAEAEASWLDRLDEGLSYQSAGGAVRAELGGLLDFEGYTVDGTPPGLVFSDREYLIAPRMSLFLDSRWGGKLYSLVQMRFDRGFDPNSKPRGDERLDEYFLRYTPWEDGRVLHPGGEVRHDSWHNPFVNAPLPYENVLTMTDSVAPPSAAAFLGRKSKADEKGKWLPVLWGPSYAAGALVGGSVERFDYAFELKNASISSRPPRGIRSKTAGTIPLIPGDWAGVRTPPGNWGFPEAMAVICFSPRRLDYLREPAAMIFNRPPLVLTLDMLAIGGRCGARSSDLASMSPRWAMPTPSPITLKRSTRSTRVGPRPCAGISSFLGK